MYVQAVFAHDFGDVAQLLRGTLFTEFFIGLALGLLFVTGCCSGDLLGRVEQPGNVNIWVGLHLENLHWRRIVDLLRDGIQVFLNDNSERLHLPCLHSRLVVLDARDELTAGIVGFGNLRFTQV